MIFPCATQQRLTKVNDFLAFVRNSSFAPGQPGSMPHGRADNRTQGEMDATPTKTHGEVYVYFVSCSKPHTSTEASIHNTSIKTTSIRSDDKESSNAGGITQKPPLRRDKKQRV